MAYIIRNEAGRDHRAVEELTRRAFWNLHVPGCDEHYLVHVMRDHQDFVPELAFVTEEDGRIVGNIMYTKARLVDEGGGTKEILTFGPVSVAPELQRRGYGRSLIGHSLERAAGLGFEAVVIFGNPGHYVGLGFRSCKRFGLSVDGRTFPAALLAKELRKGALAEGQWRYEGSPVYDVDGEAALRFDASFEPEERQELPRHEEYYILSHATLG